MKLAPVVPPPIPTAADKLADRQAVVPKGFKVEVWASGIPNARTMRQGDKGTVFVGAASATRFTPLSKRTASARSR